MVEDKKTYNFIGPFSRFSVDGYHCKKTQQYSLVNLEHISHPCASYPEMSKKMGSFQLDIKARFVRTGGFLDWIGFFFDVDFQKKTKNVGPSNVDCERSSPFCCCSRMIFSPPQLTVRN